MYSNFQWPIPHTCPRILIVKNPLTRTRRWSNLEPGLPLWEAKTIYPTIYHLISSKKNEIQITMESTLPTNHRVPRVKQATRHIIPSWIIVPSQQKPHPFCSLFSHPSLSLYPSSSLPCIEKKKKKTETKVWICECVCAFTNKRIKASVVKIKQTVSDVQQE